MLNEELESELERVRQALANSIAVEKQIEAQIEKNKEQIASWQKRASMARSSRHEELAAEAEERILKYRKTENELEIELLSQRDFSANLKKDLASIETRRFTSGSSSLKEALESTGKNLDTIGRMERKILESESLAQLSDSDKLDREFKNEKKELELDEELKALKASIKKDET